MSTALAVQETGTALAVPNGQRAMRLLRPIAEPADVIDAQNAARDMVHKALVKGRDYGVIPGAGEKPTMLKPGAERVALAFGCYYGTPEIIEQQVDHDREVRWIKRKKQWRNQFRGDREFTWTEEAGVSLGLYRYVVRVPVIERATNDVVGSGIGSCSSMESKYIDRPRDTENTILKMAHKRAMVAACLVTFGLSDEFTQDVEDMAQFTDEQTGAAPAAADAPASEASAEPAAKCPKCGGAMWDNRDKKTNPKAPDFKCRDKGCDGVYWPGAWPPPPTMTDEQKAEILTLLETADLNDEKKAKTREKLNDQVKPLSAAKAAEMIHKLQKLAEPADPSQGEIPLGAAVDTKLRPGKVQDALDTNTTAQPATPATPAAPTIEQLTTSLNTLLKHKKLTKDEREQFTKAAAKATTVDDLRLVIAQVEELIEAPF